MLDRTVNDEELYNTGMDDAMGASVQDFDEDDPYQDVPEQDGCCNSLWCCCGLCSGSGRKFMSLLFALCYAAQDSPVAGDTMRRAAIQFDWMEAGKELESGLFPPIIVGVGVLSVANTRSFYHLAEEFWGKSGGVYQQWRSLSGREWAKKLLCVYVATG